MEKDIYGHNVNEQGVEIKASTSSSGKTKIDIYDSCPADNPNHKSIHINYDDETGKGTITDTTTEKTETTDIKCFLTTACMRHYLNNFNDNCQELSVLRWFRDNFVAIEDISHYYEIAPLIVKTINESPNSLNIYKSIYEKVIVICVKAILIGNYEFAYNTYRDAIIYLENEFVKPDLHAKLIRCLSNI